MADQVSKRIQAARDKAAENTNPLTGLTPTQADAWIQANVTDLASAKVALRRMVRILANHEKRLQALEDKINKG